MEEMNFFPSSPEAVIEEYITAAAKEQKERINKMSDGIEEKLMNLAGFYRRKNKTVKIYAEIRGAEEGFLLPVHQKFKVGGSCFETEKSREIGAGKLTGVYTKEEGHIYFTFDKLPSLDREPVLYVWCREEEIHTEDVRTEWYCLSEERNKSIKCIDGTAGFSRSGSLTFNIKGCMPEKVRLPFMEKEEYVIKGVFRGGGSAVCGNIKEIRGPVLPLVQKDTLSEVYFFREVKKCYIYSDIMEEQYIRVYGRKRGEPAYICLGQEEYRRTRHDYGRYYYQFFDEYESVAVATYSAEIINRCEAGFVYGYDGEELQLGFEHVEGKTFCLILEIPLLSGEVGYDIVKPGEIGVMGFQYELDEGSGTIRVISVGDCAGSKVCIGELAVSGSHTGILSAGTEISPVGYETDIVFSNVADIICMGREESFEGLKKRFLSDVYSSYTAVTERDYEDIIRQIKGISVQRVRATGDTGENTVKIAVYTEGMGRSGKLPERTRRIIGRELEKRRLLSTKIVFVPPVFAHVNVSASVAIKKQYPDCEKKIRGAIENATDYLSCGKNFGEPLFFEEVYQAVIKLACVSFITQLEISPADYIYARHTGSDIKPADNCLLKCGDIRLTLQYED